MVNLLIHQVDLHAGIYMKITQEKTAVAFCNFLSLYLCLIYGHK